LQNGTWLSGMVHDINQFMRDIELPSLVSQERQVAGQVGGEGTLDHERLRYVTRLLGSRQGLTVALFGAFLFLGEVGDIWDWPSGWLGDLVMLGGGLAMYRRWIPSYYQRRFGSVEAQEPSARWFGFFLLTLIVLLFVGQPLAHYLDPRVLRLVDQVHLLISDTAHQINLTPSLLWITLFFIDLRGHMRSWERPGLCFLLGGLVAFSSIAIYGILHPDARQFGLWKVLNAGGFGLSFMVMGFYDHIVLVRTLPKRAAEGGDE
jgi:hypothetical protein